MRPLSTAMALVTCGALLAGCGGSPEASPAPSPSPTESATASSSPTPPEPPASIGKKSKRGAIEAAKFFLAAMAYSAEEGDTATIRTSYTDFCTRCEAIADGIDETYRDGGQLKGGAWVPRDVRFYNIDGDVAYLDIVVDYEPQTWTKKAGAEPERFPASRNVLKAFNVRWNGSAGWSVSALDPDA